MLIWVNTTIFLNGGGNMVGAVIGFIRGFFTRVVSWGVYVCAPSPQLLLNEFSLNLLIIIGGLLSILMMRV